MKDKDITEVLNLVIHPESSINDTYKSDVSSVSLDFEFFKDIETLKMYLFKKKDRIEFKNKKVMLWIHPELGTSFPQENIEPSSASKYAANDLGMYENLNFKKLSRNPKSIPDENIVSTLDLHNYLLQNYDYLQTFSNVCNTILNLNSLKEGNILYQNNNYCNILIISALAEEITPFYNTSFFDKNNIDVNHCHTHKFQKSSKEIIVKGYCIDNSGMVDAAIHTSKLIEKYRPEFVIMNGVCGGNPEKRKSNENKEGLWFGDIIIPDKVFTFQKGKTTDKGFEKESETVEVNQELIKKIKLKCKSQKEDEITFQEKILKSEENWIKSLGINELKVFWAPMACGTSVISKKKFFTNEVKSIHRKAIALEMESYAVMRACMKAGVTGLIIKSIMDFTIEKEDNYKEIAAYTSAKMTELIIKEVLEFTS